MDLLAKSLLLPFGESDHYFKLLSYEEAFLASRLDFLRSLNSNAFNSAVSPVQSF